MSRRNNWNSFAFEKDVSCESDLRFFLAHIEWTCVSCFVNKMIGCLYGIARRKGGIRFGIVFDSETLQLRWQPRNYRQFFPKICAKSGEDLLKSVLMMTADYLFVFPSAARQCGSEKWKCWIAALGCSNVFRQRREARTYATKSRCKFCTISFFSAQRC